jgi:hypothetical protein
VRARVVGELPLPSVRTEVGLADERDAVERLLNAGVERPEVVDELFELLFDRRDDDDSVVEVGVTDQMSAGGQGGHGLAGATRPLHREKAPRLAGLDDPFDGVGLVRVRLVEAEILAPPFGPGLPHWVGVGRPRI